MEKSKVRPLLYDIEFPAKLILFVLWPFGAFLYSLKRVQSTSSYVIFFLFGIVFCWHMNPVNLLRYDDLMGIMDRFVQTNITTTDLVENLVNYFSLSDNAPKEIYEIILMWFTKKFSNNPHLYFALASIPFLFFSLKSMRYITDDVKFRTNIYCLLIVLFFILPRDIITVQNPRFATGLWLIVFATISFYQKGHKFKYYLLIVVSPLIHSAFWFYVIIFTIGLFITNYNKFIWIIFYCSLPFAYLNNDFLRTIDLSSLQLLPSSLSKWITVYMSEENFDTHIKHVGASGFFWVSQLFSALQVTCYIILTVIIFNQIKRKIVTSIALKQLYNFYIFFFSITNFAQCVPVLGSRFFWIVRILAIYLWFKFMYPLKNKFLWLLLFCCSWEIFNRYFHNGAVESSVPLGILYESLPNLIIDFWGVLEAGVYNVV